MLTSLVTLAYRILVKRQSLFFPPSKERGILRPRPADTFHVMACLFCLLSGIDIIFLLREAYNNIAVAEIGYVLPRILTLSLSTLYPISLIYSIASLDPIAKSQIRWTHNTCMLDIISISVILGPLASVLPIAYFTGHSADTNHFKSANNILKLQFFLIGIWDLAYTLAMILVWYKLNNVLRDYAKSLREIHRKGVYYQWRVMELKSFKWRALQRASSHRSHRTYRSSRRFPSVYETSTAARPGGSRYDGRWPMPSWVDQDEENITNQPDISIEIPLDPIHAGHANVGTSSSSARDSNPSPFISPLRGSNIWDIDYKNKKKTSNSALSDTFRRGKLGKGVASTSTVQFDDGSGTGLPLSAVAIGLDDAATEDEGNRAPEEIEESKETQEATNDSDVEKDENGNGGNGGNGGDGGNGENGDESEDEIDRKVWLVQKPLRAVLRGEHQLRDV
ncbi:8831_t:CDS:2 [Paraglomus brasilianum]|uniref:8831_t:CDS:1 n=1 Tax=Paraglomus brasilianum TaxID=144538 RepID=A0A9N8WLB7_9GLOM|nr:8831_t:CDS:2 [Paraglomus brasilianum]